MNNHLHLLTVPVMLMYIVLLQPLLIHHLYLPEHRRIQSHHQCYSEHTVVRYSKSYIYEFHHFIFVQQRVFYIYCMGVRRIGIIGGITIRSIISTIGITIESISIGSITITILIIIIAITTIIPIIIFIPIITTITLYTPTITTITTHSLIHIQ